MWARRSRYSGEWEFKGATRTEELHKILVDTVMIRRLKEDVLKDLPPKSRHVVPIQLNAADRKTYREAKEDVVAWLYKNYSREVAERASRTEAMQRVNILKQLTAKLKLPYVIEWTKQFLESDEKLMMFGWHVKMVESIAGSVEGSADGHRGRHR